MRFNFFCLLLLCPVLASAAWSGVAFELSDTEAEWNFDSVVLDARSTELSFRIEEKTESGLRVGASIGHFNLRLDGEASAENSNFDGQFLSINLRQPYYGERFSGIAAMNYRFQTGSDDDADNPSDIDWTELEFRLGAGVTFSRIRFLPQLVHRVVDGDVDGRNGSDSFELEEETGLVLRFDYLVDSSAIVRMEFFNSDREGFLLSFAREL